MKATTQCVPVVCDCTHPSLWLTLQKRGTVRIYVTNHVPGGKAFRTTLWRPKTKKDREAIRRLLRRVNQTAFRGDETDSRSSFV